MRLNRSQLDDAQEIARRPELVRTRRILTLYKKNDEGLALFRIEAANHLIEILTRTIARKKLLKATREWLETWSNDPDDSIIGNAVRDFCSGLERESGLLIIN